MYWLPNEVNTYNVDPIYSTPEALIYVLPPQYVLRQCVQNVFDEQRTRESTATPYISGAMYIDDSAWWALPYVPGRH